MIPEELQDEVLALAGGHLEAIAGAKHDRGELTLEVAGPRITAVCEHLKAHGGYDFLADLTCRDNYPLEPRFQVVYHLYSIARRQFLRLKVSLPGEDPRVETVSAVWPAASWHEREVFDLFGVFFHGHTDLRRILLPEHFEGHPLRRDYPTEGVR
jgi:NADH-quinone oxidoreductase subunit C